MEVWASVTGMPRLRGWIDETELRDVGVTSQFNAACRTQHLLTFVESI